MSLRDFLSQFVPFRFPRVSGDEPGISRALGIEEAFSPRERG